MPSIQIALSQSPVFTDPTFSVNGRTVVVGTITVTTARPLTIGGLKLLWTTSVSKRVHQDEKKKHVRWGKGRVVDTSETMVLDREQIISAGKNSYEFVIDIPVDTLDTRTTHFDKVTHTLSAGLLSASPCYDDLFGHEQSLLPSYDYSCSRRSSAVSTISTSSNSSITSFDIPMTPRDSVSRNSTGSNSRSSSRRSSISISTDPTPRSSAGNLLKALYTAAKTNHKPKPTRSSPSPFASGSSLSDGHFDGIPMIASTTIEVPVFTTSCAIESDPSYRYACQGNIEGLNAGFVYTVTSSNLALGGMLDIDLSFKNVIQDATIHSISLTLKQTTTSIDPEESVKRVTDEYDLWTVGSSALLFSGRARPVPRNYVWRGKGGLELDKKNDKSSSILTPNEPVPSPRIHQSIYLPSPIIGAVSSHNIATTTAATTLGTTTSSQNVEFPIAEVSHRIDLEIIYSVLGQGPGGTSLPLGADGRPVEGILRSWTLGKEILIANDTRTSGLTAPPGYPAVGSNEINTMRMDKMDKTVIRPSALIPWKTDYESSDRRWMRSVMLDEKALKKRVHEHFEDTEGFCECFADRSEVRQTWPADHVSEAIEVRVKV